MRVAILCVLIFFISLKAPAETPCFDKQGEFENEIPDAQSFLSKKDLPKSEADLDAFIVRLKDVIPKAMALPHPSLYEIRLMSDIFESCPEIAKRNNLTEDFFHPFEAGFVKEDAYRDFQLNLGALRANSKTPFLKDLALQIGVYRRLALDGGVDPTEIQKDIDAVTAQRYSGAANIKSEEEKCNIDPDYKRFGPARDQDGTGWCWAFAASELVSYKIGKRVSAADLAVNFNFTRPKEAGPLNTSAGAFVQDAVLATNKRGFCLEEKFSSENHSWAMDENGKGLGVYQSTNASLNEIAQFIKRIKTNWRQPCSEDVAAMRYLFPSSHVESLFDIVKASHASYAKAVRTVQDKACEPRIKVPVNVKMVIPTSNQEAIKDLNEQLRKHVPVAISISGDSLKPRRMLVGPTAYHGLVVIGRAYNIDTRSCDYIVKNSWGRGCSGYLPEIKCVQNRDLIDDGYLVVPSKTVAKTQSLTYVE